MASLSNDKKTIQFTDANRERKTIRLGKMKLTRKAAETILTKVEALNSAAVSKTSWDNETAQWLGGIGDALHDKLAAVGLVPKRAALIEAEAKTAAEQAAAAVARLGAFLDSYIVGRTDIKPGTAEIFGHVRRCLIGYFGVEKPLGEITPGDADDWRRWLADSENGQALGPNTVRRRCGIAKQFFRAAVRRKLITENPLGDMKGIEVRAARDKFYFVTREEAAKVLDACPDSQWQLIFALSRYGGLRCPSEHLALTWGDVDWERGRMRVRSPKTAHHEGKESRLVPIFPELRPYLEAAWEQAEPGTVYVITRTRDSSQNWRTPLIRIIERAGLTPWEKLFVNLRSTRETELAETYPMHVVCDWIGNSEAVAAKHYLQVTDAHFEAACGPPGKALHQALQFAAVSTRKAASDESQQTPITADSCGIRQCTSIHAVGEGFEPPVHFRVRRFSRPVPSTTRPPDQNATD